MQVMLLKIIMNISYKIQEWKITVIHARKKEQKRNCYIQVMLLIMNIAYLRYDTDTINFFSIESPNRQLHN